MFQLVLSAFTEIEFATIYDQFITHTLDVIFDAYVHEYSHLAEASTWHSSFLRMLFNELDINAGEYVCIGF